MQGILQLLVDCIHDVEQSEERLVLLVGTPGSGKSKLLRELDTMRGWKYIDAGMLVSQELLESLPRVRGLQAPMIMARILSQFPGDIILIDRIQQLFAPVLNLEVLPLLKRLSKGHTIVAAWPGEYNQGTLTFFYNGQEKKYLAGDIKVIEIG